MPQPDYSSVPAVSVDQGSANKAKTPEPDVSPVTPKQPVVPATADKSGKRAGPFSFIGDAWSSLVPNVAQTPDGKFTVVGGPPAQPVNTGGGKATPAPVEGVTTPPSAEPVEGGDDFKPEDNPINRNLGRQQGQAIPTVVDSPEANISNDTYALISNEDRGADKDNFASEFVSSDIGKRVAAGLVGQKIEPTPDNILRYGLKEYFDTELNRQDKGGKPDIAATRRAMSAAITLSANSSLEGLKVPSSEGQPFFDVAGVIKKAGDNLSALGSDNWTTEQWDQWNVEVFGNAKKTISVWWTSVGGLIPAEDGIDAIAKETVKSLDNKTKQLAATMDKDPAGSGFLSFIKSDPMWLLAPIGALLMLFGNSPLKIVGLIAGALGGFDIFKRMNNLMGSSEKAKGIQDQIGKSLNYYDVNTKQYVPFGDFDKIQDPEVRQAITDFKFASHMGVAKSKMKEYGKSVISRAFGPRASVAFDKHQDILDKEMEATKERLAAGAGSK